ncbi:hypothetical protein CTI12_AA195490 [Artemisia annua]|uniref:Uncharacterized protein n=1 Tax=Artemisia annua TaxID=35608 RepID=A0A2U1P4E2_ARTAN|nr:hypothetical protein CTI12_AA195490 [Artemisia annua]
MPEKMVVAGKNAGEDGGFMVDPKSNGSGDDISSHIGKNKQFLPKNEEEMQAKISVMEGSGKHHEHEPRIAMEMMKQGAMMTLASTQSNIYNYFKSGVCFSPTSDKAGKLLAEMFVKGFQGFSFGAGAIFKCLENLAESNHVVLLGAPIAIQDRNWEAARKVKHLLYFVILYS